MMKVLKWEMIESLGPHEDQKERNKKLLEEGWEPFAVRDYLILFRRPVGYIEVEERTVREVKKPVVTKTLDYNLDQIEKISEPDYETSCHNNEDGIEYC